MRSPLVLAAVLGLATVLGTCPVRAQSQWHVETVDADHPYSGGVSVAVAPTGQPAVAYGHFIRNNESSLRFAVRTSAGAWPVQTLDSQDDTGHGPNLAFDTAGRPHVVYYSYWSGPVKYATETGSGWQIGQVAADGVVPSMALDTSNRPCVAYCTDAGHLMYAAWNGAAWSSQTVDTSSEFTSVSLALDQGTRPRISYYDSVYRDLKYAEWTGTLWNTTVVDDESAGQFNALAVDSSGRPHIAYYDQSRWHLKYAVRDGSTWSVDRITDATGFFGPGALWTDIALDDADHPRIIYNDWYDTDSLMFASWDGAGWTFEAADPNVQGVSGTALALDDQGRPYVAYISQQPSNILMVAWVPEPASLALLAAGCLTLRRHGRRRTSSGAP